MEYTSEPETIELARETMRDIKAVLTRDADGRFPTRHAETDWHGMNMQAPTTAWQDMRLWERYDLLLHVLDESIWSLESNSRCDEPRDSQKLAWEFIRQEPDFDPERAAREVDSYESRVDEAAARVDSGNDNDKGPSR